MNLRVALLALMLGLDICELFPEDSGVHLSVNNIVIRKRDILLNKF